MHIKFILSGAMLLPLVETAMSRIDNTFVRLSNLHRRIAPITDGGKHMTEIVQVDLQKKNLAAMPSAERRLLLLLGHAANEINVIQRLILMSGQRTPRLSLAALA